MNPILRIEDLHVVFDSDGRRIPALSGVSLTLRAGRITGIVGESGSGKSVLAASILRLLPRNGRIAAGRILLERDGGARDLTALNPMGREIEAIRGTEIGMVFQEPMAAFSPVHTVGNQMVETVRLHRGLGRKAARELAVETLRRVGIANPEQRFSQYAFELSGGMRQRAMIATAVIGRPRLLIADEPTTALDVTIQAQVLDLVRRLRDDTAMGVMFITHDLGVVAQLADEVAVMYLGRIVERGPVRSIFSMPRHPYTANLLAAVRGSHGGRGLLTAIPGHIPGPSDRPAGCAFHPRCSRMVPGRCDVAEPAPTAVGPDHFAACINTEVAA